MATLLAEGTWPATVLNASRGEDDRHNVVVRINVHLDDGPSKGRMCTYEDVVNAKSSIYIARSAMAVGWKGNSLDTLADDCDAWVKRTGGKTTAEIEHIAIKKGKKYDKWVEAGCPPDEKPIWDKCKAIGRGRLAEPSPETKRDADDALRSAIAEFGVTPPPDDVPHAGATDDDIPF